MPPLPGYQPPSSFPPPGTGPGFTPQPPSGGPPHFAPPAPHVRDPWWKRWWVIGLAGLILGAGIGGAAAGSDDSSKAASDTPKPTRVTTTVTTTPTAPTKTVTATPTPPTVTKKIKVTPRPRTVISGDGTFLVGSDIVPGTYRNRNGGDCYWARLSGTSGDFSQILANNNTSGQAIVTILPSDKAFSVERCGEWTRVR
jgi:hypothetical protein